MNCVHSLSSVASSGALGAAAQRVAIESKLWFPLALRYVIARFLSACATDTRPIFGRIVSAYRSPKRQLELIDAWNNGNRKGLVARPATTSLHMQGLAVDVTIPQWERKGENPPFHPDNEDKAWMIFRETMERLGTRWGGNFKRPDPVHFDMDQIAPRMTAGELISRGYSSSPPDYPYA